MKDRTDAKIIAGRAVDYREWLFCKKMTGNEGIELAENIVSILRQSGYDIMLNDRIFIGDGFEKLNDDGSLNYEVGIKELKDDPHKKFGLHEALAPVVTACHEVFGHGGQWINESQKESPLSQFLIMNDIACKSSSQFYGLVIEHDDEANESALIRSDGVMNINRIKPMQRYFNQPHEIAAQYMGLKMAQKFLSTVYGDSDADRKLCEYVNLRVVTDKEYIKIPDNYQMKIPLDGRKPYMMPTEPFTSMNQVYDRFQKTFIEQVSKPSGYDISRNFLDHAEVYIESLKYPWERMTARSQFNKVSERMTQIYALSAIWLDHSDNMQWISELPALKNVSFPKKISDLIRNAPDRPKDNDLDLSALTEDDIDFTRKIEQIDSIYRNESEVHDMNKDNNTMVIDGRLHIQGDDGLFRRMPLSMDEARLKTDSPVYRVENGKPVKVEPEDDFTKAVESIPTDGQSMER